MHVKNRISGLLIATALTLSAPAIAVAEDASSPLPGTFTGNVALTNDYVFRGFTQTQEDFAIQGGVDWDSGMGLYVGAWASNIQFGVPGEGSAELDLYAGYRGSVDGFTYDLGGMYYWYPGTASALDYDFWEIYGKAGYDFGVAAFTLGINYSPDAFGAVQDDSTVYYSAALTVPVAEMLSISGGIGYTAWEATPDYTDWNIGATLKVYDWFNLDARYYDTDISGCGPRTCESRFVVKVSRTF
jgi:uncharacterized protein (TIGR02001 family)